MKPNKGKQRVGMGVGEEAKLGNIERFLQIFYDWKRNEKCKNYIQLDQLKNIERTKTRFKTSIEML